MPTPEISSTHPWLRRLSDYHSGGVSEAERAAVETHLQACAECQHALESYRRFYELAKSPLRLGEPSDPFEERATSITSTKSIHPHASDGQFSRHAPRATMGMSALVAACLLIVGFVSFTVYATQRYGTRPLATLTPGVTVTSSASASTIPNTPFVCANPQGSDSAYAYIGADDQVYMVTGCSKPRQLTHISFSELGGDITPISWSPSHRYLAVNLWYMNPDSKVGVIDTQTNQLIVTNYNSGARVNDTGPDNVHQFIGWLDDTHFVGAIMTVNMNVSIVRTIGPTLIVSVDLHTGAEKLLTKLTWSADTWDSHMRIRGDYLFYAGYVSAKEGGIYLHRVSLTTGADTQFVRLGVVGYTECQSGPPCNWSAPWDVTADGSHVIYHSPAPTLTAQSARPIADTPLIYANIDGSSPVRLFDGWNSTYLSTPTFSPDGQTVVAYGQQPSNVYSFAFQSVTHGPLQRLVYNSPFSWRGDSAALVFTQTLPGPSGSHFSSPSIPPAIPTGTTPSDITQPLLYDIATGKTIELQTGTSDYLWAV